jgi:two-component system response regulator YesN
VRNEDIGIDLEKVIKYTNIYQNSVDVRCQVINSKGETVYDTSDGCGDCRFCRRVEKVPGGAQICRNAHLYGSYQAERFGGKYVFFCPLGLTHWASPIIFEGSMRGAIVAGPVQMVDPDDFLIEELLKNNNIINGRELAEIHKYIDDIPVIGPERVNSMSEMLFMVTAYLSGAHYSDIIEEGELQEQQSNISGYIHHIKTMGGDDIQVESYPLEKEKELLSLIALGDKQGSQKILNEIFGHIFFSTGGNFEVIKARVLELIVLLSRAALKGGADVEQIFGLNYKYLSQINEFKTIEELTYWLSKIMARFTDCVFNLADVKHVDVIFRAIDFIRKNYMKKITLEDVAAHVYLCPSYFSKIFKEETKCNFSRYLNEVRIENSKALLLDENIPLVDVSSIVGFEDQSYFSKVFKKYVGISPGRYRESRGKKAANDY